MIVVVVLVLLVIIYVNVSVYVSGNTCASEYGVAKSIQKDMLVERLL